MYTRMILIGAFLLATAVPAVGDDDKKIELSEVPAAALAAAEREVAGFKAESAEIETEDGRTFYELEGKANGTEYEIEVTADGEVIEVEED